MVQLVSREIYKKTMHIVNGGVWTMVYASKQCAKKKTAAQVVYGDVLRIVITPYRVQR